uniref:Uncharacterized protein n=1 Tax=Aplanochytrium stocchinoi TaxID=215587 RepID=A0A7S3PQY2_9STRA
MAFANTCLYAVAFAATFTLFLEGADAQYSGFTLADCADISTDAAGCVTQTQTDLGNVSDCNGFQGAFNDFGLCIAFACNATGSGFPESLCQGFRNEYNNQFRDDCSPGDCSSCSVSFSCTEPPPNPASTLLPSTLTVIFVAVTAASNYISL